MINAKIAFEKLELTRAESLVNGVLTADDSHPEAWNMLAAVAIQKEEFAQAKEALEKSLKLAGQTPEFSKIHAELALTTGNLPVAESEIRKYLKSRSRDAEGWLFLARCQILKGDHRGALTNLRLAARIPNHLPGITIQTARVLQKLGRIEEARSTLSQAMRWPANSVEDWVAYGRAWEDGGRLQDAITCFRNAAGLLPGNADFYWRIGKRHLQLGNQAEGIAWMKKAAQTSPNERRFFYPLGRKCQEIGAVQDAYTCFERCRQLGDESADIYSRRGVALYEMKRYMDAYRSFWTAITKENTNPHFWTNLGAVSLEMGQNSLAMEALNRAMKLNPEMPVATHNMANLLADRGRVTEAEPYYLKAISMFDPASPHGRKAKSNWLLRCHYMPELRADDIYRRHKVWGEETLKLISSPYEHAPGGWPDLGKRKIRLGFVSPDFCNHPVAYFMKPFFEHYDRSKFEVLAYSAMRKSPDSLTKKLMTLVDTWRDIATLDDAQAAKQIYEDKVDVLFDLAGHTAWHRMDVFARKPAPVQVSYLGYPATTGLPTIEYRITDPYVDPVGHTEAYHTEKLVRLSDCAWCFEPPELTVPIQRDPVEEGGGIVFGCFNNMTKWSVYLYRLWAQILHAVPGSRLRLKSRALLDQHVANDLKQAFASFGIPESRLWITGHTPSYKDHLLAYNGVDIALDTFPYHGTTTTCEALWMGVPVVTLVGGSHVSRVGLSLLKNVGLVEECIAYSLEDYVAKAVRLAGDRAKRAQLREELRPRMEASSLMDAKGFARHMEEAITGPILQLSQAHTA